MSQNVCFGHKLPIKHTCKKATSSTAETGAHDLTHVCALTYYDDYYYYYFCYYYYYYSYSYSYSYYYY